jgi:hypothetical protein
VIARASGADAAVVDVPESAFAGLLPQAVPLAPPDYVVRPGATLTSVGCANGSWSTGWKGHALGCGDGDLYFLPTPANGRSGSAVFDSDGRRIVGLIRARSGDADGSYGIASDIRAVHAAFAGGGQPKTVGRPSACGSAISSLPTQCGPDGCYPSQGTPWRLSPYRHGQDENDRRQDEQIDRLQRNPVYPTLPPAAAEPKTTVDLEKTNGKIDGLAEKVDLLIAELRKHRPAAVEPIAPQVPPVEPPDQEAMKAAEEAKAAAAAVKADLEEAREETSGLRKILGAVVGQPQTLPQRFTDRVAKVKGELDDGAGHSEVARAYVKDLAVEKLSGTGGWTIGRIAAGALGVSGPLGLAICGAALLVSRRIGRKLESGDPLVVERVVGLLGQKIDDLRDRLEGGGQPATQKSKQRTR